MPGPEASAKGKMKHRLGTKAGRELYAQRKQTIEPIFGIIKGTLGFRRLSLRGLKKMGTEWTLVTLAYNLKRLFHMGAALSEAQNTGRESPWGRQGPLGVSSGKRPPESFPKTYRIAPEFAAFGESASRSVLGSRFSSPTGS